MGASLEAIFLGNVNIGGVIAAGTCNCDYFSHNVCNYFKCRTKKAAMTLAVPIGMLAAFVVMFF